jgi:peptidoglycan/LPS O-acetylase OafA/YrhL
MNKPPSRRMIRRLTRGWPTSWVAVVLCAATAVGLMADALARTLGEFDGSVRSAPLVAAAYAIYCGNLVGVSIALSTSAASARPTRLIIGAFWLINAYLLARGVAMLLAR